MSDVWSDSQYASQSVSDDEMFQRAVAAAAQRGGLISLHDDEIDDWPSSDEMPLLALLSLGLRTSPIPLGPVGSRYALCRAGQLRDEQAFLEVEAARQRAPDHYVSTLASVAISMAKDGLGDEALLLSRLLLQFVGPPGSGCDDETWESVAVTYVQSASHALQHTPNGPVFKHARWVADQLVTHVRSVRDQERRASALSASGQLPVSAYGGRPGGLQHWMEPDSWRVELSMQLPPDLCDRIDQYEMPPAVAEVEWGAARLKDAVGLRVGPPRGRTRASYALALELLSSASDVSDAEVAAEARAALEELDALDRPLQWLACLRILASTDPRAVGTFLDTDVTAAQEVRERHGDFTSLLLWAGLAELAAASEGMASLVDLMIDSMDLATGDLRASERTRLLGAASHVIDTSVRCRELMPTSGGEDASLLGEAIARLNTRHDEGALSDVGYGRSLAHLVFHCPDHDLALELGRAAVGWCGDDPVRPVALFALATAALSYALRSESAEVGQLVEAAAESASAFITLNLHETTRVAIRLAIDQAAGADDDAGVLLLSAFGSRLLRLQVLGDDEDREVLHGLGLRCSTAALSETGEAGSPELMIAHRQLFKGLLFSVGLDGPGPEPQSEETAALVREIRQLETLAEAAEVLDDDSTWGDLDDDNYLVGNPELTRCAYLSRREQLPGRSLSERLTNARLDLETAVTKRRYAGFWADQLNALDGCVPAASLDSIQTDLGPETVLLDIYFGMRMPDLMRTVYAIVVTREDIGLHVVRHHDADQGHAYRDPAEQGRLLVVHPQAHEIAALREELLQYSEPRLLTREAEAILDSADTLFLDDLGSTLAELRMAGKTHLCIWPHGPLHLAPMHLMRVGQTILADQWTVTTIPSTRCLPPYRFAGARPVEVPIYAAAAPGGGRAFGLPYIASLASQADSVAATFGGQASTREACSPTEVLRGMEGARYVHLAAHGSASGGAPMWQHLYLEPGSDGESRLFAHDVFTADLRNTELVTLSACESALGRFDAGDDLRGLPAALMLAGAQAIVGALWSVHPDPANAFFTRMYERLAAGDGRLQAFREAQLHTRSLYPAYRHWGAFSYLGGWH